MVTSRKLRWRHGTGARALRLGGLGLRRGAGCWRAHDSLGDGQGIV